MKGKQKKGISLIVLVITIIVIIILAVAVILTLGNNNPVESANQAVFKNDVSEYKSELTIAIADDILAKNGNRPNKVNASTPEEIRGYVKSFKVDHEGKFEIVEDQLVYIGEAGQEKDWANEVGIPDIDDVPLSPPSELIIPSGFHWIEGTIANGAVIEDEEGNQFVWIPVEYDNNVEGKHFEDVFVRVDWGKGRTITEMTEDNTTTEYLAMKASVERNKGFYIARYEAGKPDGKSTPAINGTDKPISKKGATFWNNIRWGTNNDTVTPGDGAVTVARTMYKDHPSVVSTLCYDIQWDTVLKFIEKTDATYPKDSTGKGNYEPNSRAVTGSNEVYKVNNIYDMAGNAFEWTMAGFDSRQRGVRGGNVHCSGSDVPAGYRESCNRVSGFDEFGFRAAIYIK